MFYRIMICRLCFALALVLMISAPASAEGQDPEQLVQSVYSNFLYGGDGGPSDFALLMPMASAPLRRLMEREIASQQRDGLYRYDFSVIVDGQDYDLQGLEITSVRKGEQLEVSASFRNFERPTTVVYVFEQETGRWALADVRSGEAGGWSLRELLR